MLVDAYALDPDDSGNHLLAARIDLEIGDYPAARRNIEAVLSAWPSNVEARLMMFELQGCTGEQAAAERTIIGLLHENPDTEEFYALYAQLMLQTLHVEKAGALAAEALRLDPTNRLARIVSLLVAVIEGRKSGAGAELEELVRDDPEALHVAWSMIAVLQSEHRYGEALEVMRGILHATPDDEDVVESLVQLRVASHWSTVPLWPLTRYGWAGSGALWVAAIAGIMVTRLMAPDWTGTLAVGYLVYVVYSWVWPPILRRWVRSWGF